MEQMRLTLLVPGAVQYSLVLLLEICRKCWSITATITLGGYGYSIVVWFMLYGTKVSSQRMPHIRFMRLVLT